MSDQLGKITSQEQCSVNIMFFWQDVKIIIFDVRTVGFFACVQEYTLNRETNKRKENEKPNIHKQTVSTIDFYSLAFKSQCGWETRKDESLIQISISLLI